jgi:ADP-ribosylglycohydrolase
MKTVWLTVGFAAGYVLGAKAGRERYEQIARATREFINTPEIAEAQAKVKQMAERGREAVRDKLHSSSGNGSEMRVEPAETAFPTPVG